MNNTSDQGSSQDADPRAQQQHLLHTALLSVAVLLIPILAGILLVLAADKLKPASSAPSAVSAADPLHELGTATNKHLLARLRQDLRSKGMSCDEADLRLWAAELSEPERLFHVKPPDNGGMWNWHVARGGRFAVAAAVPTDELDRRKVALYDLTQDKWLWQTRILWPDSHSQPYVFKGHLILRYSKNALRFALELDDAGRIISLDALGPGQTESMTRPLTDPALPGLPVASEHGVAFTVDQKTCALCGYAAIRVPGLRYAGKGDDNTVFSGNGLLKFDAAGGEILVHDSLTQTLLQRISAWRDNANTKVNGMRINADGSHLSLFLVTEFSDKPPVRRDWQINVNLYTGQKETLFKPDSAAPERRFNKQALSPDGRWTFQVAEGNALTLSPAGSSRIAVKLPLQTAGLKGPVSDLAFLEGGRHLRIRQDDNFWLLDFAVARGYGGLLARCAASASPEEREAPTPSNHSLLQPQQMHDRSFEIDPDTLAYIRDSDSKLPAALSLKAELLAANQAWGHVAAALEKVIALQEYDTTAPGVNLLLLARCQILAGDKTKARNTCRAALNKLIADPTAHNRMIRYHLQGLYFAEKL